jgi:hypothetical protein
MAASQLSHKLMAAAGLRVYWQLASFSQLKYIEICCNLSLGDNTHVEVYVDISPRACASETQPLEDQSLFYEHKHGIVY